MMRTNARVNEGTAVTMMILGELVFLGNVKNDEEYSALVAKKTKEIKDGFEREEK